MFCELGCAVLRPILMTVTYILQMHSLRPTPRYHFFYYYASLLSSMIFSIDSPAVVQVEIVVSNPILRRQDAVLLDNKTPECCLARLPSVISIDFSTNKSKKKKKKQQLTTSSAINVFGNYEFTHSGIIHAVFS